TRDRKELDAEWAGVAFKIVDTGGGVVAGDAPLAQGSPPAGGGGGAARGADPPGGEQGGRHGPRDPDLVLRLARLGRPVAGERPARAGHRRPARRGGRPPRSARGRGYGGATVGRSQ